MTGQRLLAAAALGLGLIVLATGGPARGADDPPPGGEKGGGAGRGEGGWPRGGGASADTRGGPAGFFRTNVPERLADVVAGRPTRTTVVLSVRATRDAEGMIEWRSPADAAPRRTALRRFVAGEPAEVLIDGLAPGSAATARLLVREAGETGFETCEPVRIHTQRPAGASFTFAVQADSHLDQNTQPALYERTLAHVAAEAPDFLVDLGDTFMTDKRRDDFRAALPQYVAQRWYFSLARVPVFLVLGNHDGETSWRDRGSTDDMTHWSLAQRKRHFPNPEPGGIYTGNAAADAVGGLRQNWFGWEWGDAQFLVLDPFQETRERRGRDAGGWGWTLGDEQFRWLASSLAASRARFRFVFIHHLVGGLGGEARGGAEAARLFEWGGRSPDGKDEFAARRPGFSAPVHELLRRAGNAIVFHGHDHFFAHQELDGVAYQMVPQPGHPGGNAASMAAEYGYAAGDFLASPGYVRVRVAPDGATVELVRSSLTSPKDDGTVAFSSRVPAARKPVSAPGNGGPAPR